MRGAGRIFLRGSTYWIAYYNRGGEVRESAKTDDPKKAERFLKHRVREVGADAIGAKRFLGPQAERITVNELLDALEADLRLRGKLSVKTQSNIKPLRSAFGEVRANQVTTDGITRYVEKMLDEGYKPASVNRRTQLLGQAFKLALRQQRLSQVPYITRLSEVGNTRTGFFERADFLRVVENLPEHLRDYCRFAFITGWRRGSLAGLPWSDVNPTNVTLPGVISKTRKPESVPLEGEIEAIIERRKAARVLKSDSGQVTLARYVFHNEGAQIGDFRKSWASACRMAGVSDRLFHDFRRTAARNLILSGVPESVAMQITGHKTNAMFKRYAIVSEAQKSDALRNVAALHRTEDQRTSKSASIN